VRLGRRQKTYLALRAVAAVVLLLGAFVLPHGVPAGLLVMLAGLIAVMACIGVTAGGPGESAGARGQERWLEGIRPPQGDWPPFDPGQVLEGELVQRREG
jgi:hypothetical protein